ncbi:MAG: squalene-hopene/tetraprenyl-beta-curcumene cyclase [Methylobacteriaceae bacterium]|jgi:squalene-hopene/tetraprenyl-beta-curcumene cyclase|nr:squalene-hopene/tetraprenyl-beta-curcumene cyclase [Methylobacteriaceae bacterium]
MMDVATLQPKEADDIPGQVSTGALDRGLSRAAEALFATQRTDGHFVFELEADCTIPAEYILFVHFLGETPNLELEAKLCRYLRRIQGEHGGWPLFHDGAFNMSASVKAYFALKMAEDDINAPHMVRAREAILARGGAAESNVFTRSLLALYRQAPWRSVPVMPVEIMLLPRWFPFHLDKISYWARTTLVPLMALMALRPKPVNPRGVGVPELFVVPPEKVRRWPSGEHAKEPWKTVFAALDSVLRVAQPYFPKRMRRAAVDRAVAFCNERLNGEDGLGAIFPPMLNVVLMYDALGYPPSNPNRADARAALDKLLVIKDDEAYCQPCFSPIWDSGLAANALLELGGEEAERRASRCCDWLKPKQILDVRGDWAAQRPNLRPGGWAFQYDNAYYPDVDDTAVVVMAMDRLTRGQTPAGGAQYGASIARAREWIEGMQSRNGGWGAFDVDNEYYYLNNIPFADHGALLDPPTEDVSARCVSMLAQLGAADSPAVHRGVAYLRETQRHDGSWFGRWGMNYIYGTWSVLCALNAAGIHPQSWEIRRAVAWLLKIQNTDGGWGEDGESYKLDYVGYEPAPSTASQTAWAILGLMAAGECDHPAVERGINYLIATQGQDGFWNEPRFTATGFPRVFYLCYHGYSKFFPLWAMARYRNLKSGNTRRVEFGV